MTTKDILQKPFIFNKNRVWRTYSGGKRLEEWQGSPDPTDNFYPEEWVASTVKAFNAGREQILEGLSELYVGDDKVITLKDLIELDPETVLGKQHVSKFGTETALLVKVLDASERLTIQVHPDRDFAKAAFHSLFGKTEAWYILEGRQIDGEDPYVLFNFKPGVTRDKWKNLFDNQNIDGMIDALHRIPVQSGDVFLVEGGIPHAIGSGCFLIEVQEPTDYTLRVERTTPRGNVIPDLACHQGLGFDHMLEAFHYETYSYEETLKRWRKEPTLVRETEGGKEYVLIGKEHTDRFRMNLLEIRNQFPLKGTGAFSIAIIISGSGKMLFKGGIMDVKQADEIFLPAALEEVSWESEGNDPLKVIFCYPPD